MRKSLTGFMVIISVGVFNAANAAYIIKLKNGNEYLTNRYWQDGTQILFDTSDGVFGIEKTFVGTIEKTDKVIKLVSNAATDPAEKPKAAPQETAKDASKGASAEGTKAPVTKDPNDPVYREFSALKEQSDSLRTMSRDELDQYVNHVVELKKKIQNDRKVNQYLREFSELNAMADEAEAELKSRG